jgi:hypothetical protein
MVRLWSGASVGAAMGPLPPFLPAGPRGGFAVRVEDRGNARSRFGHPGASCGGDPHASSRREGEACAVRELAGRQRIAELQAQLMAAPTTPPRRSSWPASSWTWAIPSGRCPRWIPRLKAHPDDHRIHLARSLAFVDHFEAGYAYGEALRALTLCEAGSAVPATRPSTGAWSSSRARWIASRTWTCGGIRTRPRTRSSRGCARPSCPRSEPTNPPGTSPRRRQPRARPVEIPFRKCAEPYDFPVAKSAAFGDT